MTKFPSPPIQTPFRNEFSASGISQVWIEWLQQITKDLSVTPGSVTGSTGGNAALKSLLTQLATQGLIVDNSSI